MKRSSGNSKASNSPVRKRRVAKQAFSAAITDVPVQPAVSSRWATGRDVVLALVMAIGLSTVFLSPLRFSPQVASDKPTESPERVLGASITIPLAVSVIIKNDRQEWRSSVTPITGTLAEVLARSANAAGSTFEYSSRGSSIYLTRFLNLRDDQTGVWVVRVNGIAVTDLSQSFLEQADEITVERQAI